MFGNVPLVFCGVNDFEKSMVDNLKNYTGVKESVAHLETIELAKKLFPKKRYLLIVLDGTMTAQKLKNEVEALKSSKKIPFEVVYYSEKSDKEIETFLTEHKKDIVTYLLTFNRDKNGKFYSYKESIAYFRKLLQDIPIVGSWSFFLGKGIVGGAITSGYEQGHISAKMAKDILDGKDIRQMPIIGSSKTIKFYGDIKVMNELGISVSRFPANSSFVNRTKSFWMEYIKELLVGGFFVTIIFIVFASAIYLKIEENSILENMNKELDEKVFIATKQLKESEKLFRFIADNSQNVIFLLDTNFELVYINSKFNQFAKKEFDPKNKHISQYLESMLFEELLLRLEKSGENGDTIEEVFEFKDAIREKIYRLFCFVRLDTMRNIEGYKVVLEDMTHISKKIATLTEEINHDKLTNLYNRSHFEEMSVALFEYAKLSKEPLSLIVFDIDHFKQINDTFGHLVGDEVLKRIAVLLKEGVRKDDKVYRIGGEEFAIILKNFDKDAFRVAEHIREKISEDMLVIEENHFMITVSAGIVSLKENDQSFKEIFKRADKALYDAKASGRNTVFSI